MSRAQRGVVGWVILSSIACAAPSVALASGRIARVGGRSSVSPLLIRKNACAGLPAPVFALCDAFCKRCATKSQPFCESLRKTFKQLTRQSFFPCEARRLPTRTPKGATPTPTSTPTPTTTPVPECPLAAGSYTFTQLAGGFLTPDGLDPFPFPPGGTILLDVGPPDTNCVHPAVAPATTGFIVPVFCIGTVNFNVSVVQAGCGVGQIDSDGGSDYDVREIGDTSSTICQLPHPGCTDGIDSSMQLDITVGNGSADVCSAGSANMIVSLPVETTVWVDADTMCPDPDGVFDPGTDALIVAFPQIFDFSTDATFGDYDDIDADGCCIAGAGPSSKTPPCNPNGAGAQSNTGVCLDLQNGGVTLAASGVVASAGRPLFDTSFTAIFPYEIGEREDPIDASCATPPVIDFTGTATRCIDPEVVP